MTAGYGSTSDARKRRLEALFLADALEQACEDSGGARVPKTAPDALTGNLDGLRHELDGMGNE